MSNRTHTFRRPVLTLAVRNIRAGIGRLLLTVAAIAAGISFVTAALVLTDSVGDALVDSFASGPVGDQPDVDIQAELRDEVDAAIVVVRNVLLAFAGVALFVALFLIANTFSMMVAQRTRQIGLLRAIGASGSQVRRSVLCEAAVIGLIGSLVGLVLGTAAAVVIIGFIERSVDDFEIGLVLGLGTIAFALTVGVGATVVSAAGPILTAGRVSPTAAIGAIVRSRSPKRWRLGIGVPLLAVGVALLATGLFMGGQEAGFVMAELAVGAVLAFVAIAMLSALFAGPVINLVGRAPVIGCLLLAAGPIFVFTRLQMLADQDSVVFYLNPFNLALVIIAALLVGLTTNSVAGRRWVNTGDLASKVALLSLGMALETGDEYSTGMDPWFIGAVASTVIGVWMLYRWVRGGERIGPVESVAGLPGDLARRNAVTAPHRTASTATALTIGLALIAATFTVGQSIKAGVVESIEQAVAADLVVVFEGSVELDNTGVFESDGTVEIDTLAQIHGVTAVDAIGWEWVEIDGREVGVTVMDDPIGPSLVDIGVGPDAKSPGVDGILVHVDEAGQRSVGIGDVVEVGFPVGFGGGQVRELTVTGFFERDYNQNRWVMEPAAFDGYVEPGEAVPYSTELLVAVETDANVNAVARALRDAVGDSGWVVREPSEVVDQIARVFDVTIAIVNGLLGLTVLVALFGVVNTISLSVIERTREIGLLRAVGMTGAQVRQSIRWEAVFVCVFGAVLGLGLGIGFGLAAVDAIKAYVPATSVVPLGPAWAMLLAAMVAGVGSAALPARRAARIDVLDAIGTP